MLSERIVGPEVVFNAMAMLDGHRPGCGLVTWM
jgi:hypothetical protein